MYDFQEPLSIPLRKNKKNNNNNHEPNTATQSQASFEWQSNSRTQPRQNYKQMGQSHHGGHTHSCVAPFSLPPKMRAAPLLQSSRPRRHVSTQRQALCPSYVQIR